MARTKGSRSQKEITHDEIQALLTKLKEIVPNMPRNRKLSKLEIIQYVIDYIVDLQIALESHPRSHLGVNVRNGSSSARQPLGVISSPSNSAANTCIISEPNHVEKLPSQRPEAVFRSVSC
ncbi:UNVERIFIED_CONTAM: id2 [Trichonephila clavipes]